MIRQFKTILFAIVLGTITMSANAAFVSNTETVNNGTEENIDAFSKFINNRAGKFVKKNIQSFNTYNEVVNLYNNESVAFYNLSNTQKAEFDAATEKLTASLGKLNSEEAKAWASKVNENKMMFDFIWSSKQINVESENVVELTSIN